MASFDKQTIALHGSIPRAAGPIQTPISATTSYKFESAQHAEDLFALRKIGDMYSRMTNPTVDELAGRLAKVHGAAGAFCASSGHAAQLLAFLNLMQTGDHIVASKNLYGGTITQLTHTFPKHFGWSATLVNIEDPEEIKYAIRPNTKCIFAESQANPNSNILDIEMVAEIAHQAGIPLIVDNTIPTYHLCDPIKHGADILLYSLSKYITGNNTIIGGAVVDSGNFDWSQNGKFPFMTEPDAAYHNLCFNAACGPMAFTFRGITVGLRDLGTTMSPLTAFEALKGMESLEVRMDRHVKNAKAIAEFLNTHPKVKKVNFPTLENSPYKKLADKYLPKGASGMITAELDASKEEVFKFIDSLEIFINTAQIGDSRSLIIHPDSTIHSQLTERQKKEAGVHAGTIRLSIGIENIDDLKSDLEQALASSIN